MNTGYPYRSRKWIMSADGHWLVSEGFRKHSVDQYGAPNFSDDAVRCPYCGKEMPDGIDDPAVWECCGEMGHATSEGD